MAYEKLYNYAPNAIAEIIPIDKDLCKEMVTYALSLPTEHDLETYFMDLLGMSDDTFNLISNFKQLKKEEEAAKVDKKSDSKKAQEKPPPAIPSKNEGTKTAWSTTSEPKKSSNTRLKHNTSSVMTSELADAKPSNKQKEQKVKKTKKKNLDNLKDIEAALNDLEVQKAAENDSKSQGARRVCNCMATRHPLFEVAPNCLNCGKIICSKEGLQPCSFCGQELLSPQEKNEIIKILKSEKIGLDTEKANPVEKTTSPRVSSSRSKKGIVVSVGKGENLWKAQEAALKKAEEEKKRLKELQEQDSQRQQELEEQIKELEHYEKTKNVNPDLLQAQERLDTLLNFQATGAERTRIIDNAADFEMPHQSSGSMWLSPTERALQLKKQQKQQRKAEEQKKQRTGRTKKVVEMVIKDGKVKMVEKHVEVDTTEDDENINKLEDELHQEKLEHESSMAKNTWDYENDANKWSKPVYISTRDHENNAPAPGTHSHPKVQFGNDANTDELLVAMPS